MGIITEDLIQLYAESDALALADHVRKGRISAAEAVETAIVLVERLDPKLNAVVIRTFEIARQAAAKPVDGPFAGVPFLLKNIGSMWKGTPLTAGLACLAGYVCDADSEMSRRMRDSGLAVIGRANTPECGWSITTEPRLYGPTVNPWNGSITAGGSSGGSAAAVAARIVPIAEAADGGGSIRVPASCCGIVGLKPSRGRITYGPLDADVWNGNVATLCNSRSVRDTAAFLDAIAGGLPGDPYVAPRPQRSWLSAMDESPQALKIGFTLSAPWGEPLARDVRESVQNVLRNFERLGHAIEEHCIQTDLEAAWRRYNDLVAVEAAGDCDRWAGILGRPIGSDDLSPFNATMVAYGRAMPAAQFAASLLATRKAGQTIACELDRFDAFVTPTLTQPPRPVGYWSMEEPNRERYLARWSDAAFMFAFNISGLPAISIPAGATANNAPIGVQIVGRHGDEATILQLARHIEVALPWIDRRPGVCAG